MKVRASMQTGIISMIRGERVAAQYDVHRADLRPMTIAYPRCGSAKSRSEASIRAETAQPPLAEDLAKCANVSGHAQLRSRFLGPGRQELRAVEEFNTASPACCMTSSQPSAVSGASSSSSCSLRLSFSGVSGRQHRSCIPTTPPVRTTRAFRAAPSTCRDGTGHTRRPPHQRTSRRTGADGRLLERNRC